ncbi:MAG: sugar phosphate isomerase/epimerase [Clostridia bacterium]|nr:sugar phosphate isomerase/epimerase [Clostridia bacterium]
MSASDWQLGLSSCCAGSLDRELMETCAAAGVEQLEISMKPSLLAALNWQETVHIARETGVGLWSLHLPFYPGEMVQPSSPDPEIRRSTLAVHSELIRKAGDVGVRIAVVHPSFGVIEDHERDEHIKRSQDTLAKLAETAAQAGVTLAVENMTRWGIGRVSSELLRILEADSRLRVCFDTNHTLIEPPEEYVRAIGSRLATIHVSDFDRRNERHWLPGEGVIDWPALVTALEDAGYTGPWMYEVDFAAPKSITRRTLTCEDFYANYKAVTAKQKPEVLGIPIKSECDATAFIQ